MARGSNVAGQVDNLFAEGNAQFVSFKNNERIFDEELTRHFPVERDNLIDEVYTHLTAIDTVTGPMVEKDITFDAGVWRVVDTQKVTHANKEPWFLNAPGVVQVLRRGFDQSTSLSAALWQTARVVNFRNAKGNETFVTGQQLDTQSDDPDHFLLVEFKNLDPATAPALCESVGDTSTISALTIRGQTAPYTGEYHVLAATVLESEHEGDGSARLQILLAQPQYTLEAYRTYVTLWNGMAAKGKVWYLWGVPKDLAQTIMDDYQGSGRSASAEYNRDASLVNLTLSDKLFHAAIYTDALGSGGSCSFTDTVQFYWGVYDPTDSAYDPASFSDYASSGITYERSVSFDRDTGTFDIIIRKRTAVTRRYLPYVSQETGHFYDTTYMELNVTAGAGYLTAPAGDFPGVIYQQNVNPNADCSSDINTMYKISEPRQWYDCVEDRSGIHGFWWFINQRGIGAGSAVQAIQDALDDTQDNRINVQQNADLTYNVTVSTHPNPTTIKGYANFYYTTVGLEHRKLNAAVDGSATDKEPKTKPVAVYYVHRVSYHATEAAAYQSDELAAIGSISVGYAGGVWRADRIVRVVSKSLDAASDSFYLTGFKNEIPTTLLGEENHPDFE